jgi:hypothetical protein
MKQSFADIQAIPPRSPDRPMKVFLDQALREYRDKVMERVLRRQLRKPWMKYREIRVIEDLLIGLQPMRCLEWGVGFGTLHFPRLLPKEGQWQAVEHDSVWAGKIGGMELPAQVKLHNVPPDSEPWSPANGDGDFRDFRKYVQFPARYGPYDFILVDGRAREACLLEARSLLAPQGVVVLHDANRDFLRMQLGLFPHQLAFRDYRRYSGGVWMGSMDRDLTTVIDVAKHSRIWRIYNSLGRRFRL